MKCTSSALAVTFSSGFTVIQNHKSILFGLFYRPPKADSQYFSNIEDSISLAIDTSITDIIVTGDFNLNFLNAQARRKIDMLCTQLSLYQPIDQPTHYTEHSSSLIDIILVSNKDNLMFSGVGDPFLNQDMRYHCPVFFSLNMLTRKQKFLRDTFTFMIRVILIFYAKKHPHLTGIHYKTITLMFTQVT